MAIVIKFNLNDAILEDLRDFVIRESNSLVPLTDSEIMALTGDFCKRTITDRLKMLAREDRVVAKIERLTKAQRAQVAALVDTIVPPEA